MSKDQILSLSQFKDFILFSLEQLKEIDKDNDIILFCEEKVRDLTSADHTRIVYYNKNTEQYHDLLGRFPQKQCLEKSSIFTEVLAKHQILLVKDLKNSLMYQEQCDNMVDMPIKELILVPLMLKMRQKTPPDLLVWCYIEEKSPSSFFQKNVLYLVKYLAAIKPFLLQSQNQSINYHQRALQECLESSEYTERRRKHNEQHFHSTIHDIRTPMNALMGFLALMFENETDPRKCDYLDMAQRSGDQMIRLINDALDMAKVESGELQLDKQPCDIAHELRNSIKIFYETARKKHIELTAFIDPSTPVRIVSDYHRINQVLSNLLSNAIKFTQENGSIFVEILYDASDDTLTIGVKDSGIGISEEEQRNIFLPYRQEENSTEANYGGTGLGLSISQQIVALIGGKLTVASKKGEGSHFYFSIPANTPKREKPLFDREKLPKHNILLHRWEKREDNGAEVLLRYLKLFGQNTLLGREQETLKEHFEHRSSIDIVIIQEGYVEKSDAEWIQMFLDETKVRVFYLEGSFSDGSSHFLGDIQKLAFPLLGVDLFDALYTKREQHRSPQAKGSIVFSGKRVLVVDDSLANLRLMEEILKLFSLEIELAENAKMALAKIKESNFDLVFMDEHMPGMLGSEAIAKIRESEIEKKTDSQVLISLSGDSRHKKEIFDAGANELLTKPVNLEDFREVVEKYLS